MLDRPGLERFVRVWTADSATPELRAEWIRVLDDLEALQPTYVVAGHRTAGAPTDLTAITHTRDYLEVFEKTVADAANAADAEAALLAAYPDAGLKIAASLGTKVAKGEMAWGRTRPLRPLTSYAASTSPPLRVTSRRSAAAPAPSASGRAGTLTGDPSAPCGDEGIHREQACRRTLPACGPGSPGA